MSENPQAHLAEVMSTVEARTQPNPAPICLAARNPHDLHRFAVQLVQRLQSQGLNVAVVAPTIEKAHTFWQVSGHLTKAAQSYVLERKFNVLDQPDVLIVVNAEELESVCVPEGLEFTSIKDALLKTSGVVLFTTMASALPDIADDPAFATTGLTIPHVMF